MNWEERLWAGTGLSPGFGDRSGSGLPGRISGLLEQQKATWPLLRAGYEGLAHAVLRRISLGEYEILAQQNPLRLVSTAARVDPVSIERRPCFLCPENLPPEEKGIAFGTDWVVLCNPFPILDRHLSIVYRQHIPQAIDGRFEVMLDLSRELDRDYFVIYNGPECGASAPDHLHLQACARDDVPLESHLQAIERGHLKSVRRAVIARAPALEVFTIEGYHLPVLIGRSADRQTIVTWFYRTISSLREITHHPREALINMVVFRDGGLWTAILFPRSKHRPSCYFAEGEARLTVSPASVDLAGYLVIPIEEHFQRIQASDVRALFAEVTLPAEPFKRLSYELARVHDKGD